nr:hypothetical protein [Tanacetum cinerariifolium]
MTEQNNYIFITRKNCIFNDNEGRMIERNFVEIHGAFLVKIRDNTFNGEIREKVFEHINKFLEIVGPVKINRVSQDQFWLSIFPISLAGAIGEWFKKDCIGSVTTWDDLVKKFVQKFYQLSDHNDEIEKDDDPDDITDIFKIKGNLFDFETPFYEAFKNFNFLLKIDKELFTFDIQGTGTYEEYKLNNLMTRDIKEAWLDNGVSNIFGRIYDTRNAQDNQRHEECRDDPTLEPSVCKIRIFEMMKYSFNDDQEYISIKESEYHNHSKDNLDAYQELLHIIDEGWVTLHTAYQTPSDTAYGCVWTLSVLIIITIKSMPVSQAENLSYPLEAKATPKKVRKSKKVASPSKKLSPVLEEELTKKPKRAKKPTKKSATMPTAGVVIRDTPGVSILKKKEPTKVDRGKGMDIHTDATLLEAAQ